MFKDDSRKAVPFPRTALEANRARGSVRYFHVAALKQPGPLTHPRAAQKSDSSLEISMEERFLLIRARKPLPTAPQGLTLIP